MLLLVPDVRNQYVQIQGTPELGQPQDVLGQAEKGTLGGDVAAMDVYHSHHPLFQRRGRMEARGMGDIM